MLVLTYVDMRWHIALYSWICVDKPGSTNVTSCLEDLVLNDIPHLRESMLELVRHHQTRIAGADSDDTYFSWGESKLIMHRNNILR